VEEYLAALTARLRARLAPELVGVYLMGSAGMGAYEPGVSDLDVWALVQPAPSASRLARLAEEVDHAALPCPARGLELVVARLGRHGMPRVAMNLTDGPAMPRHVAVALDAAREPGHWFVIDAAIGRDRARALAGPPPAEAFPPIPRSMVLDALVASLDWHAAHEPSSANAILNALRGWRYAVEGVWTPKREAAAWAAARRPEWAGQIASALAARARA
jgi:hypothetical protein